MYVASYVIINLNNTTMIYIMSLMRVRRILEILSDGTAFVVILTRFACL